MDDNILIYVQDPGGAKYILPLVQLLQKNYGNLACSHISILVHTFSTPIYNNVGIAFQSTDRLFGLSPITEEQWHEYLVNRKIRHILCSTSSPAKDMSNSNLIVSARRLGIKTLGIMDHWKGFGRFFHGTQMTYMPAHLCCIDEGVRGRLQKMGMPDERVSVVGHPYLEIILKGSETRKEIGEEIKVLLVSQPDRHSPKFSSIFCMLTATGRVVDDLAEWIENISAQMNNSVSVRYRPHPKECQIENLPSSVMLDDSRSWDDALQTYDMFIGLDSMALVEAHLSRKKCITLMLEQWESQSDGAIPYGFSHGIDGIDALRDAFEGLVSGQNVSGSDDFGFLKGSGGRFMKVLSIFTECNNDTKKKNDEFRQG